MKRNIKTQVDIEQHDGPLSLESQAEGRVTVRGPSKFHEAADPHVRIALSHDGDAIGTEMGELPVTEWGSAGTTLSMDEVEELHWALNDMLYKEEAEVMVEDYYPEEE